MTDALQGPHCCRCPAKAHATTAAPQVHNTHQHVLVHGPILCAGATVTQVSIVLASGREVQVSAHGRCAEATGDAAVGLHAGVQSVATAAASLALVLQALAGLELIKTACRGQARHTRRGGTC